MLIALLLACPEVESTKDTTDYFPGDADADGYSEEEGDCNDDDRSIHPGASEIWYDDIDQDCSGGSDHDQDGDGAEVSSDCDDADPTIAPGLPEECNGIDDDCDDEIDEDIEGSESAYVDADYDGWGDENAAMVSFCDSEVPAGYSLLPGDCDDSERSVAPDALEICDGLDNDCDAEIDEDAVDASPFYIDADLDGYGDEDVWVRACEAPEGWSEEVGDCDDTQSGVHPGADEYCNERDDDCDETIDENAVDRVENYEDVDGDGYGAPGTDDFRCEYAGVLDNTDCDDEDAAANPGATEVCDLVDNDCDSGIDEDLPVYPAWTDADGDGHGDATLSAADSCGNVGGVSILDDDCNDADATISPSATEVCDDIDNDCSGDADSDAVDASFFYVDVDADGYGVSGEGLFLCEAEGEYTVTLDGDCDDEDATRNPGVAETDDDRDEDCDGWVDEDWVSAGDIVITEVARQPWIGGTSTVTDAEWFEVYNAGSVTIDLASWVVTRSNTDAGTDGFAVDPSISPVLAPGDYAVFCETELYALANDANSLLVCDYTYGDPTQPDTYVNEYIDNTFHLQRDEDTLAFTLDTTAIDSVTWSYDATMDTWPRVATYSMQLDPLVLSASDNDDYVNWCATPSETWYDDGASAVEYGTPGWENEDCP